LGDGRCGRGVWSPGVGGRFDGGRLLGIALDADGPFPGGEDARVGAVLMGQDGVEFAQELHAAAGQSRESGGAACLDRETLVFDPSRGD
jgi:hypothetical protein